MDDPAQLEERARKLRAFAERHPEDESAWFGLGRALAELGRPGEAAAAFRGALERKPDYTAAWRDLGRALLDAGDAAAAGEAFERGLAVAERSGDLQTGREIEIFLRRARKRLETDQKRSAGQ